MTNNLFYKDPDALKDYAVDWTDWLDGDTIAASQWIDATDDLTIESDSFTSTVAIAWISGGTVGQTYVVTNRITTAAGRIDDRSIEIRIQEQ